VATYTLTKEFRTIGQVPFLTDQTWSEKFNPPARLTPNRRHLQVDLLTFIVSGRSKKLETHPRTIHRCLRFQNLKPHIEHLSAPPSRFNPEQTRLQEADEVRLNAFSPEINSGHPNRPLATAPIPGMAPSRSLSMPTRLARKDVAGHHF